jgi:hypothetical protein
MIDIGQPEDDTVHVAIQLGDQIPNEPLSLEYRFLLDTDNDMTTGAVDWPDKGADYQLAARFDNATFPSFDLAAWDPAAGAFHPISGLVDASFGVDRGSLTMTADLEAIGTPAGPIAAWAVVNSPTTILDVKPPDPKSEALGLTPVYAPPTKVGGAAQDLPDIAGAPLEAPDSSGGNGGALVGLIAGVTAGVVALGGAAWYARRRQIR